MWLNTLQCIGLVQRCCQAGAAEEKLLVIRVLLSVAPPCTAECALQLGRL